MAEVLPVVIGMRPDLGLTGRKTSFPTQSAICRLPTRQVEAYAVITRSPEGLLLPDGASDHRRP